MGTRTNKSRLTETSELRRQAEERLRAQTTQAQPPRSREENQRLVHELEVHQIELEMQNAELRQAREELETALLTCSELYDFAPAGYFTLDRGGKIKALNLCGASLLGHDRSRLVGRRFGQFVAPSDHPAFSSFLDTLISSQDKETCEVTLLCEDMPPRIVQIEAMSDSTGQECRLVVIDISEHKLAAEKLHQKNAEVEQFIYTVSHDLRSPVVTVKTFLGYLEHDLADSDPEQLAQDLQFIRNAADKMAMLLDELLVMSRIDRVETLPVQVPLSELLTEVVDAMAGVISEQMVEIHLSDTDLMLFCDRSRVCQIWQNLIENAIKYRSGDSLPRIELGVRQKAGEMVFYVKDNGIGVDPQHQSKIFGMFEKLDSKSSGAGLGLSMIQRIVEKCGGRVWVESQGSGQGSCFYFTLPHCTALTSPTTSLAA